MKSSRYWFYLLIIVPFINAISFRLGDVFGILAFVLPLVLFIIAGKKHRFTRYEKTVFRVVVSSFFFIILGIFFSCVYSVNNLYYYRFFCLSFLLMPIFLFLGDTEYFINKNLLFILRYYIVLISSSIVIGAFLKSIGLDRMELMYDAEKWNYLTRPFGIFGQPSINSCLLCFFYLFHRSATKLWSDNYIYEKDWLFYVVILGVVFQGSGSGFVSLVFVLLSKLSGKQYNIPWLRISVVGAIVLFIVYQIVLSGLIQKIGLDYMTYLIDYLNDEIIEPYKHLIRNRAYLLWGVPDFPLPIDLGPLYMVGTIGLVMTIYIFMFLFYMLRKTHSLDMKLGFILLVVGNLHYPVMFYMIMHFMWYIIIYYVLVIEKNAYKSLSSSIHNVIVNK